MRCPYCTGLKTGVLKTERPLDEGYEEGDIKKRTRKCRQCAKNFVTFEIHESTWRGMPTTPEPELERRPLLDDVVRGGKTRRNNLLR